MEFVFGLVLGLAFGIFATAMILFGGFGGVKRHAVETIEAFEKRIRALVIIEFAKLEAKIMREFRKQ